MRSVDLTAARRAEVAPAVADPTLTWELPEPFPLELGGSLARVVVAYRTWGSLAPDADNAVVVCHALTGSADVDAWWPGLLGPGRALDPARDFVVCANVLGSCYGTTGPASIDPATVSYTHLTLPTILLV